MNTVQIKNTHGLELTIEGIVLAVDEVITLTEKQVAEWRTDDIVFAHITNIDVLVGDGTQFFTDPLAGWNWISGNVPVTIKQEDSAKTPVQHAVKVAMYKAEGSSTIAVTPSFCDPTTWYQDSAKIEDETMALLSGNTYSCQHSNLIDMIHGKVYMEDSFTENGIPLYFGGVPTYKIHIRVGGVEKTEDTDFIVDYSKGEVTFTENPSQLPIISYWHAQSNTFSIVPEAGKLLNIEHSELQFTIDMEIMSPIHFDIYVYNPSDLPNKVLYKRTTYKNIKDIINAANLGTGTIPKLPGLSNEICVFPFDYATLKTLKSSQGTELRISTEDGEPFTGEWGTCTFIMFSQDEA